MNKKDNSYNKGAINGFSKLSKLRKIQWIAENFFKDPENVFKELSSYWHRNDKEQELIDGFSENTISNFILPYGVAPNFLINGKFYCVPMVIEESSVVAAASSAAKYWSQRGGIQAEVIETKKNGQVHFFWKESEEILFSKEEEIKKLLLESCYDLTLSMTTRGGGIEGIYIKKIEEIPHAFQVFVSFETCDSMGANFINSVLENMADTLRSYFLKNDFDTEILMSILSNYNPDCIVKAKVDCSIEELGSFDKGSILATEFAEKFYYAVKMASVDPYRAVTHNKGIFNGIDAVVLATANDFRAIEAGGHAYAARDGHYRSLSSCSIENGRFSFELEIPLAIGTVGGLTSLHPMAKKSLELLGNPNAEELMQIIAATGLAQNFAALRSLVTSGIQKGHMKMHLENIMRQLDVPKALQSNIKDHFKTNTVSVSSVKEFYRSLQDG